MQDVDSYKQNMTNNKIIQEHDIIKDYKLVIFQH